MNMQNLAALAAIASNGNGIPSLGSGESLPPELAYSRFTCRLNVVQRACKRIDSNYFDCTGACVSSLFPSLWIKKDNFCEN